MIGRSARPQPPNLEFEAKLRATGYRRIAGLDEVGRGCLAGPVAAAAVILPLDSQTLQSELDGVRDSKELSAGERGTLYRRITATALDWAVGVVDTPIVDVLGIVQATRLAMGLALGRLTICPDFLLIDYLELPSIEIPQQGVVDGDARCLSIAAASIVAKVSRDSLMHDMDARYPGYDLASHKGYGTPRHRWLLHCHGPCEIHRLSFAPLRLLRGQPS